MWFAAFGALEGCFTVQKFVTEIAIEIGIEQTRLFPCNRFHYAEKRQSPSRFFSGSYLDYSVLIFSITIFCIVEHPF